MATLDKIDIEPNVKVEYALLANLSDDELTGFRALLTPLELERASRFHAEKDRQRSIAARAILRIFLSTLLGLDPKEIEIVRSPTGKPFVPQPDADRRIHFNISHSGDVLLLAAAQDVRIGVDVEEIRTEIAWGAIARRFYAASENAELGLLPEESAAAGFFRLWTTKEAYLKATGHGLSIPLANVEVRLHSGGARSSIVRIVGDAAEAAHWQVDGRRDVSRFCRECRLRTAPSGKMRVVISSGDSSFDSAGDKGSCPRYVAKERSIIG